MPKNIPKAAAPLSEPGEGIVGLFHTGVIWDGHDHQTHLTLPMKFDQATGNKMNVSVFIEPAIRANDTTFWEVVDSLSQVFLKLQKQFEKQISDLQVKGTTAKDLRRFIEIGQVHKLDLLRLITEKNMMDFFRNRYTPRGGRKVDHKVLGFGPVKLPAVMYYQDDEGPSELLIRHLNNLSNEEITKSRVFNAKYVWLALSHLFRFKSFGILVWLYLNTASLGLQREGGNSSQGTMLLIARLLDRINMSPYDFSNISVSGYITAILMLHASYNLTANILTNDDWVTSFPLQLLHNFSLANATEHYNGQVDLLSKCGWKRDGGSLNIAACPFYNNEAGGASPGLYDIKISGNPNSTNEVTIPLDWGGINFKKDGSAIPSIPADFDRLFRWRHDPQAEGVSLDVKSVLPWVMLTAPPEDSLHSSIEFWYLYFYTVYNTRFSILDAKFHPLHWFVGFESILQGNGFPVEIDGDNQISVTSKGRGKTQKQTIIEWLDTQAFTLQRGENIISTIPEGPTIEEVAAEEKEEAEGE